MENDLIYIITQKKKIYIIKCRQEFTKDKKKRNNVNFF